MTIQVNYYFTNYMTRQGGAWGGPELHIYKGTPPTVNDLGSWATYKTTRTADLLVTLPNANRVYNASDDTLKFGTNEPTPTAATATGTATWGALQTHNTQNTAIIGVVGEFGGTGLFMLDSVNIVLGNTVTCVGFRLIW